MDELARYKLIIISSQYKAFITMEAKKKIDSLIKAHKARY